MVFRGLVVWMVIILAESLHGAARVAWLQPMVGDFRARQIAFFTGLAIILTIAVAFIRWIGATNRNQLLIVGMLWMTLTFGFEIGLGRWVMKLSWERILSDYDLSRGGLMIFGMIFLLLAPMLAARLRRLEIE
jgi:hypothetical protein